MLPDGEYIDEHLPGAINIPLNRLTLTGVEILERSKPVVVYCWDAL